MTPCEHRSATTAFVTAVLLCAVFGDPAFANDTTAELATGGLRFVQNPSVAMRSEALFISLPRVEVDYVFVNTTSKDVNVVVAFPMPDITGSDEDIALPTDDAANPLGFRTEVDGRPVSTHVEQKVFASGVDRTALLTQLHVPLAPQAAQTGVALDRLSGADKAMLTKLNMVEVESSSSGGGPMIAHLQPLWTLKSTYAWTQLFPAGKALAIHHSYQPSIGSSGQTDLGGKGWERDPNRSSYRTKYCPDAALLASLAKATPPGDGPPLFSEQRIDYVLHTGANWSEPIHTFKLVIDKGDEKNLLSTCTTGLRKVSPTRFEVDRVDFTPQSDIKLLILAPNR